jgi:hypothetical protein
VKNSWTVYLAGITSLILVACGSATENAGGVGGQPTADAGSSDGIGGSRATGGSGSGGGAGSTEGPAVLNAESFCPDILRRR